MRFPRDFGPWQKITIPATLRCYVCEEELVTHAPAFVCMTTGKYLCGACGVRIVVHHFNEQREGVNT